MDEELARPVADLKGVGVETARRLQRLGISTVHDLVRHYPRRYEDFSHVTSIGDMRPGLVTVRANVERIASRSSKGKRVSLTEAILSDGTGTVKAIWFNQPFLMRSFPAGSDVYVSGKLEFSHNNLAINAPAIEMADRLNKSTGRIVPTYPETEGLTSKQLRGLILPVVTRLANLTDPLPASVREAAELMPISQALREIHFPTAQDTLEAARHRLAFEELFFLVLSSLVVKNEIRTESSLEVPFKQDVAQQFVASLGFDLTNGQRSSAWQIMQDMQRGRPMNRLLEGDVGSGKTLVAALAAVMALANGSQAALMVPTEVLARQHAGNLAPLLAKLGYEVQLIVGGQSKKTREELSAKLTKPGQLIIGTHALITTNVKFTNLALVIIDEQHRFGVGQRQALKKKAGRLPHLLSMTATPIPRSLTLTVYGEMDISIIDTLPPGRKPITTKLVGTGNRKSTYEHIYKEIKAGRQAFVICPLVEDSEVLTAKSVTSEAARLKKDVFPTLNVKALHGKMTAAEKNQIMEEFAQGEFDILVATSVIEVGVDVPNASIMMIENADRFGLAALHQLRGRVGRGEHQSYCFLLSDAEPAKNERLQALERTTDGFRLAQIDLEIRGPGQIYGHKQHGLLDLKLADITNTRLVAEVRKIASHFLQNDPEMVKYPQIRERVNQLKSVTSLD